MSDHWKDLADKLGTPSLDPVPRKSAPKSRPTALQQDAQSIPKTPAPETVQPPADPVPTKRSSWDSLSRLFGFGESTKSPEPVKQEAAPAPSPVSPTKELEIEWEPPPSRKTREPVRAEPSRPAKPAEATRSAEVRGNEARESAKREEPTHGKKSKRSVPSMWDSEPEETGRAEAPIRDEEPIEVERPSREGRRPRGRPVRNEAPARSEPVDEVLRENPSIDDSADEPVGEVERRGRRRRPRRGRRDNEVREEIPPRIDDERDVVAEDFLPDEVELPREVDLSAEGDEPPASRGRRRGRRGRGDRAERGERPRTEGAEAPARPERSDRPERVERPERPERPERAERPERGRHERPSRPPAMVDDDALESPEHVEAIDGEEAGPVRHIKIPTWADAIGVLVEVNAENHRRGADGGHPRQRRYPQGPRNDQRGNDQRGNDQRGNDRGGPRRGRGR